MERVRVIVSVGEALVIDRAGEQRAGGLAMEYAAAAVEHGHRGVAVSRVGQDEFGVRWLARAHERSVDVEHVQSDPDLPTGRLIERAIGGRLTSTLTANAAFDNLQWDFDLVDLAQRAEAVIFGQFARRGGQTRSVIKQFLHECVSSGGALRVFDMTNRAIDAINRGDAIDALDSSDVLVADERCLLALSPAAQGDLDTAIEQVLRLGTVQIVLALTHGERAVAMRAATRSDAGVAAKPIAFDRLNSAIVRAIVALLDGLTLSSVMHAATE